MRFLFWCTSTSILLFGGSTIVYVYQHNQIIVEVIAIAFAVPSITVYIAASCILSESKTQIFNLYFLMDNALILLIFSLVGWNGLTVVVTPVIQGFTIFSLILDSISLILFVGTYRILIVRYPWQRHEVIITKVYIISSSLIFIGITTAFMITQA